MYQLIYISVDIHNISISKRLSIHWEREARARNQGEKHSRQNVQSTGMEHSLKAIATHVTNSKRKSQKKKQKIREM